MKRMILIFSAVLFLVWSMSPAADQQSDAKELVEKAIQFFSEKGKDTP